MGRKREEPLERVIFYLTETNKKRLDRVIAFQHFKKSTTAARTRYLEDEVVVPHLDKIEAGNPEILEAPKLRKRRIV